MSAELQILNAIAESDTKCLVAGNDMRAHRFIVAGVCLDLTSNQVKNALRNLVSKEELSSIDMGNGTRQYAITHAGRSRRARASFAVRRRNAPYFAS